MHNPLHTPICDRLGIEYPVFLAGMGGVSLSRLVAAVSNAGGLGIMGAATLGPAELREEIQKTRDLTDKPFAVDLLAPLPDRIRPQMEVLFEEDVRIFVAGLAVPAEFIAEMHERDMTVMVMCGRVRHAQKSEEAGADIVGAEDLMEQVQKGQIVFDRCIATPDMMGIVGRLGKILGPRGLMPNPKVGTVTMDVAGAVKAAKAGQVEFRVEKAGIVHGGVGKVSFPPNALAENMRAFVEAVIKAKPSGAKGTYLKRVSVSSTMGPGLRVNLPSVAG